MISNTSCGVSTEPPELFELTGESHNSQTSGAPLSVNSNSETISWGFCSCRSQCNNCSKHALSQQILWMVLFPCRSSGTPSNEFALSPKCLLILPPCNSNSPLATGPHRPPCNAQHANPLMPTGELSVALLRTFFFFLTNYTLVSTLFQHAKRPPIAVVAI